MSIYDLHRAAFSSVDASVVLRDGQRVATIAHKYSRDGAGRLYAYVHWIGTPMVRGYAAGGGYDKRSASCAAAAARLPDLDKDAYADGTPHHTDTERQAYNAFRAALRDDNGYDWQRRLEGAGFVVYAAI